MRKLLFLFSAILLISANVAIAMEFDDIANRIPTGYVSDYAGIIKDDLVMENYISEFEKRTLVEIAVVTIDQLPEDHTIETFAVDLFKEWGIGKKSSDNGLLFLISVNDRKFKIEVGYGLEGKITDLTAMRIAEKNFTPNFKAGDFDKGIMDALKDTVGIIEGDETLIAEFQNLEGSYGFSSSVPPFLIVGFIIWAVLSSSIIPNPWKWLNHAIGGSTGYFMGGTILMLFYLIPAVVISLLMMIPPGTGGSTGSSSSRRSYSSSTWSSGSSSGGGGFGGFGGGMSGGGGYSGGW